ncbi:MAG: YfcC family protein [Lachnospiraceae bacterium]|nr:YfcC family protein [Lachnospiraceae bacterium]
MKKEKKGLTISVQSFLTAAVILVIMMIVTYILTLVIPGEGIPFWKWLLSPVLVLGSDQGMTMVAVILFLLVLGGTFNALDRSGTMDYMLRKIVNFAGDRKYILLALVTLFFLSMGAFIGSFEECVPMVPLAVALAVAMGWDALVGLGMSLGAVACGFATGVLNPFTTGVAQTLMGLPVFSGVSLRLLTYVLIYGCLLLFLIPYAKRCEQKHLQRQNAESAQTTIAFAKEPGKEAAVRCFVATIVSCFVVILLSVFVKGLSDYLMIFVAILFLIAGIGCCVCVRMRMGKAWSYFGHGVLSILPSVLLIMMAGSMQYTMTEAGIMDTILDYAVRLIAGMPVYGGILCIFLFAMLVNFFVASGSAEAVLLMPLLGPLADSCGISRQLTVLAYNYGDGFSNLIYFTNPCLLIALSLVGISYGKWLRFSIRLQLMILTVCCGILLLGTAVGY